MARILVAEDDALFLRAIHDTLELSGYSVCGVTNGARAIEVLGYFRPDLIVTDVMMPEMDGLELYCQVRRESWGTAIPFMFISARDAAYAVEQVARNNNAYFLKKPFGMEELLEAVHKLLRGHKPSPASPADLSAAGTSTSDLTLREVL